MQAFWEIGSWAENIFVKFYYLRLQRGVNIESDLVFITMFISANLWFIISCALFYWFRFHFGMLE